MYNDASKNRSRRDFVKQSSLIAGGLVAAPFFTRANFFAGANDEIKVAVIGCGGRGTGAAMQALLSKQNVKIVAMADAFRDNLDRCHKSLTTADSSDSPAMAAARKKVDVPDERKFSGFDGYMKAIPLADVVILATPPGLPPYSF